MFSTQIPKKVNFCTLSWVHNFVTYFFTEGMSSSELVFAHD